MSATENFAALPEPPYYAVIFSSLRTRDDLGLGLGLGLGYDAMSERMVELTVQQPG